MSKIHIHIHGKARDLGPQRKDAPNVKRSFSGVNTAAIAIERLSSQLKSLLAKDSLDFSDVADIFDRIGSEARSGFKVAAQIDHSN